MTDQEIARLQGEVAQLRIDALAKDGAAIDAATAALALENTRLRHELSLRNSELIHIATGNWRMPCGCSSGMARTVSCGARGHGVGTACGQVVKAQLEEARTSDKRTIRQPASGK